MSQKLYIENRSFLVNLAWRPSALALLSFVVLGTSPLASAQSGDLSGKEVVETVCAGCHVTGVEHAPKIGDEKAWAPLAARGLASLTESALDGIRNMPAHGGNPKLSDIEIERAIVNMVNRAGSNWIEPLNGMTQVVQRKGKQIVETQCAKCHESGVNGAPKIGNLTDWVPRLKSGIDFAVRSAINGHGPMPARGGVADLTDVEIRAAVTYMINPVAVSTTGPPAVEVTVAESNRKIAGGIEIYLGIVPADALRARPDGSEESVMHGGVPTGKNYYHVNISLFDRKTRAVVKDAQVEVRVSDPVMGGETKKLESMTIDDMISHGNYFRMASKTPYTITVSIRRPGVARAAETRFEYKRY